MALFTISTDDPAEARKLFDALLGDARQESLPIAAPAKPARASAKREPEAAPPAPPASTPVLVSHGAPAAAPVDDVHQPFTTALSSVHATLFNVTRDVETVEQRGPGSGPASQLRQHTESALYEIEQVLLGLCPHRPTAPAPSAACTLSWC